MSNMLRAKFYYNEKYKYSRSSFLIWATLLSVHISYLFQAHHPAPYGNGVWLALKHVPVGRQKPLQGVPHLRIIVLYMYLLNILHIETYNNDILTVYCAGWPAVLHISVCKHKVSDFILFIFPKLKIHLTLQGWHEICSKKKMLPYRYCRSCNPSLNSW